MIRILFCLIFLLPSFAHATAVVRTDFDGVRYSTTSGVNSAFVGTYYIDPSQETDGTGTISSPFNDWTSVTWAAGCRYYQKRGTTYTLTTVDQKGIAPTVSGTVDLPIVVADYGDGELPIIAGTAIGDGSDNDLESLYGTLTPNSEQACISLVGRSYIEVENFVLTHSKRWGLATGAYLYPLVYPSEPTSAFHLKLKNITAKYCNDIGFAFYFTQYIEVDSCTAHDNQDDGFQYGWRSSDFVFRDCIAHHNSKCADASVHGGGGGFHSASYMGSALFLDCTSYSQYAGHHGEEGCGFYSDGISGDAGDYQVYVRCIAYDNNWSGFHVNNGRYNDFVFCIAYNNGLSYSGYYTGGAGYSVSGDAADLDYCGSIAYNNGRGFYSTSTLTNSEVYNCIAQGNSGAAFSSNMGTHNYNIAYGNGTNIVYGANSFSSDPLFNSAIGYDFTLGIGSPAIGAGIYIMGAHDTYADPEGALASNPPNIGAYQ